MKTFYGIKLGQTQTFTQNGERIPVTEILVEPLTVIQVKKTDKEGYSALKIAFGKRKAKNVSKAIKGEIAKINQTQADNKKTKISQEGSEAKEMNNSATAKITENWDSKTIIPRYFKEIKLQNNDEIANLKPGDRIKIADIFKEGDFLNVQGVTIGKGFAGVVKRHGFRGGPRTHGQADRERAPGSIGQTTTPGRVYKGKRMAGRMGGEKATIKNLQIFQINSEKNTVLVKGLIPGKRQGVVKLYKSSI